MEEDKQPTSSCVQSKPHAQLTSTRPQSVSQIEIDFGVRCSFVFPFRVSRDLINQTTFVCGFERVEREEKTHLKGFASFKLIPMELFVCFRNHDYLAMILEELFLSID
jgi:hypothetical protein